MKAVVCYKNNILKLEDIPRPEVTPGHVLVRIKASGICGTDHAIFAGNGPPWTNYPIVPGHEFSGIVEETGDAVDDFKAGEVVAIDNYLRCGRCWYCANGYYFLCDCHKEIGMTINGGFAEYSLVPKTNLVKVPNTLSAVDAVLTEPVATALRACRQAGIRFGDKIVILGCGPLGILIAQISKLMGGTVILIGRGKRLGRVKRMDIDIIIDSSVENWAARVREIVGSRGADILFDVTGDEELLYPSVELLCKMGRLILMGISWGKRSQLPPDTVVLNEIQVMGKVSGMGFFEEAVKLLETRKIDPGLIITHRFSLAEYEKAIRYEKERIDGAMKVIITQ